VGAPSLDALTGLPTRGALLARLQAALASGSGPVGLLFLDLDGFKAVNDRFGHAAGDEVLREAARRLRAAVRGGDVVARLGGDEFAVLVHPARSQREVRAVAERLGVAMAAPFEVGPGQGAWSCPASIGTALAESTDRTGVTGRARRLLEQADQAMYAAKTSGTVVADAWAAVPRPVVQEVRRLPGGALVRLSAHSPPTVPPAARVQAVLAALPEWRARAGPVPVAVRLPAQDALTGAGAAALLAACLRAGLPPGALAVEAAPLRRATSVAPPDLSGRAQLARAGVRLVLVDAAGGWSARDLLALRPDEVLLEAGLLQQARTDGQAHDLAAGWVGVATRLGADVTAEAAEDPGLLHLAAQLGCSAACAPAPAPVVLTSETRWSAI
jgi:diguanylate cyclase (GGDEF)-like protein